MGWLFGERTRAELIERLRRTERYAPHNTLLESTVRGSRHWYLCKHESGLVWIGLDLLAGRGNQWGYKDMDESVGPCYYDCPISYVNRSTASSGCSMGWKQSVRDYHAKKAAQPRAEAGLLVELDDTSYKLVRPHLPRKGWIVSRVNDGVEFRMNSRQLCRALRDKNPERS